MSNRKVKVGIVGLGHNGVAHLRSHLRSNKSTVVAVCDRDPDRLHSASEEFGIDRAYSDDGIFTDPEVEAISINTGDNDHLTPFLKAVGAGKHVLVEKPLANSEADIHAMIAAAERASPSLKIQVGYILRFNPVFEAVHALARAGRLGDIYYMEGDYIHNLLYQAEKTDPVTGGNWYLDHEIPLVGGGSHPLDLLRWISGNQITRTWGFSNHVAFPAMKNDDCQVCLFQFEGGAIAKVAALYAPRCPMAPFYNLRLYGTNGTVERDTAAISSTPEDVHPEFKPVEAERTKGHPYLPEIEDWLDAIIDDRQPRTPLWDGANSTMATLCAARAIRVGHAVDVPIFRAPGSPRIESSLPPQRLQ
ncbi:MAG: Gfo/Idh/MocA family oxidoreductase [Kiritimatiellaeota bacterium]|nr:Gfo/Idh/MocA family oxidoreductase [Kiritimatiellota bacterium]